MQVKRYQFPGFTAKNAGDPVVSMNNPPPPPQKKKKQQQQQQQKHRDYRELNIVLQWAGECHLNRLFK